MHHFTSTVPTFFAARGANVTAEPPSRGRRTDWLIEIAGCSAIIEEKAWVGGVDGQMLQRAATQFGATDSDDLEGFRILWISNTNSDYAAAVDHDTPIGSPVSNDFFQSHPTLDGVVKASGKDAQRAALWANPHSPKYEQLNDSPFSKLFAGQRPIHADFSREAIRGAVSGAQPKLLLRRSGAGTYELPRRSTEEVRQRFEAADDVVAQLYRYFVRKQGEHPEWSTESNLERIRLGLVNKAAEGKWPFTQVEQQWIMNRLRELCDCNL
jgi:hypothetical protein